MSAAKSGCPSCRDRNVAVCPHVRYAVCIGHITVGAYRYRAAAEAAAASWVQRAS